MIPFLSGVLKAGGGGWRLWSGLATLAALLGALFTARQSGRKAERAGTLQRTMEIQHAQLQAAARGPRTRDDVRQRLRDGRF